MAGAGAKKRLEANRIRLQGLQTAILIGLALFIVMRALVMPSTKSHWWGLAATALVEYVTYSGIASFATPVYAANGDLVDGGADLSMKGMCGYYHDLLYITIFVQAAGAFTNWAWYAFLLIPGYAVWMLMDKLVIPYFWAAPAKVEAEIDEASRKKQERTEKRAQKRAQKWR
eukprot:gene1428-32800_t